MMELNWGPLVLIPEPKLMLGALKTIDCPGVTV
jgi:hypothetical protein